MDIDQLMLEVIDLSTEKDQLTYRGIVSSQEFHNPYYHIEYLQRHLTNTKKLVVFLLMEQESCVALLPMILNPIPNTNFWDAIFR